MGVHLINVWRVNQYARAFINYAIKEYNIKDRRATFTIIDNLVRGELSRDRTDIDILKLIVTVLGVYQRSKKTNSRANERAMTVVRMINAPVNIPSKPVNALANASVNIPSKPVNTLANVPVKVPANAPVRTYLDYGCGDGTITQSIGKQLSIPQGCVYGVDIHAVGNPNINYICGNTTNLAAASIDLVTAFVSLHHVSDVSAVTAEIYRILRPGGAFIIREHDFNYTVEMLSYLHLIHAFVAVRDYGDCDIGAITSRINYRSLRDWNYIIAMNGFVLSKTIKYTGNNPQGLYHACYIKPRVQKKTH